MIGLVEAGPFISSNKPSSRSAALLSIDAEIFSFLLLDDLGVTGEVKVEWERLGRRFTLGDDLSNVVSASVKGAIRTPGDEEEEDRLLRVDGDIMVELLLPLDFR